MYKKDTMINKPNNWAPGEDVIGIDNNGNKTIKIESSISTAIVTGFTALLMSSRDNKLNMGELILLINDSNLPLPSINKGELISGVFNPDGFLKAGEYYSRESNKYNSMRILNNLVDFSLDYYSNYTISYENKEKNKIQLYSTIQPQFLNLIFVNPNLNNNNLNKINLDYSILNINKNTTFTNFCIKVVIFLLK